MLISLQRAAVWTRPLMGRRRFGVTSVNRAPIQEHAKRPWAYAQAVQRPAGSGLIRRRCFGNAPRNAFITGPSAQVSLKAGLELLHRHIATKSAQKEVETKWWESLGLFLRGCRRSSRTFSIRRLLWKLGFPYWKLEKQWKKTRRAYKNSWLSTMVSAGITVAVGDILAQAVYPVIFVQSRSGTSVSEKDIRRKIDTISSNMKQINFCRTLQFAVIGATFVGPLSKFVASRFMLGTLRYPEGSYKAQLIIKDTLLLTPLVIALYMVGYDYRAVIDTTKKVTEVSSKDKNTGVEELATTRISLLKDEILKRYKKPFMEIFMFYVTTAPFVKMVQAFELVPKKNGQFLAKLYTLIFYCFLSHSITSNKLGKEITKTKSLKEIKNGNKGGGGGWACIVAGTIAELFKK